MKEIANALRDCLISPNVLDSNLEAANVVDAIAHLAGGVKNVDKALRYLGTNDTATPMGALELHAKAVLDSAERIAIALHAVADAIRERP